ncbi:MAG: PepSY-like domain-containing protein [Cyclobacteriaceae bacterium]|nr:PepSY-like domain-containing protein [Cyclobacteriaceae bacterium]
MKRFVGIVILSLVLTTSVFGQESEIPLPVLKEFKDSNPTASKVKWEKKKESFKVEFKVDEVKHHLWYNQNGKVIKHRYEIDKKLLPAAVIQTLNKDFSGFTVHDTDKIVEGTEEWYRIEIKNSTEKKVIELNAQGKLVMKE